VRDFRGHNTHWPAGARGRLCTTVPPYDAGRTVATTQRAAVRAVRMPADYSPLAGRAVGPSFDTLRVLSTHARGGWQPVQRARIGALSREHVILRFSLGEALSHAHRRQLRLRCGGLTVVLRRQRLGRKGAHQSKLLTHQPARLAQQQRASSLDLSAPGARAQKQALSRPAAAAPAAAAPAAARPRPQRRPRSSVLLRSVRPQTHPQPQGRTLRRRAAPPPHQSTGDAR